MLSSKTHTNCIPAQNKYSIAALNAANDRKSSFNGSETSSDDSCGLFKPECSSNKICRRVTLSTNSNSTYESRKLVQTKKECAQAMKALEGIESEYNYLILQNDSKPSGHFSILNENIRALIGKRKDSAMIESLVIPNKPTFDDNLCEEVPVGDLSRILKNSSPSFCPTSRLPYKTKNYENRLIADLESPSQQTTTHKFPIESCTATAIIPEKFRAKKLPHLDKKIRTGYVKFFDDKNNFGFMNLTSEPFGEVFVFGREFEKANISPDIVAVASNNMDVVFKFRVMYYMGKHGESKKAVNIRLSNC